MIVSFGDYKGSGLVIGGKQYTAKYRPTYFNGKFLDHKNLPREETDGTKYSLVFDIFSFIIVCGSAFAHFVATYWNQEGGGILIDERNNDC